MFFGFQGNAFIVSLLLTERLFHMRTEDDSLVPKTRCLSENDSKSKENANYVLWIIMCVLSRDIYDKDAAALKAGKMGTKTTSCNTQQSFSTINKDVFPG